MTVLPDLLTAGIASVIVGAITINWALFFLSGRYGGAVLTALSALLLVVGGGIVPPMIGILGGLAVMRPAGSAVRPGTLRRGLAALWPPSLAALGLFLAAMVVVGQLYNEFVMEYGLVVLVGLPVLVLLTLISAWARDSMPAAARAQWRYGTARQALR